MSSKASYAGRIGQRDKCLEFLHAAEQLAPEPLPNLFFWRAHWLLIGNNSERESISLAIELLTQALDLLRNSERTEPTTLLKLEQFDVAELRLRSFLMRGIGQLALRRSSLAKHDLQQVVGLPVQTADGQFYQVIANILLRNNYEAIELLRQLDIEELHSDSEILVMVTSALGRDRHALISEVVSLMPEELKQGVAMETIAMTFDNWGRAIMSEEKRREAIPYFEKASELAPKAAVPCFDLGRCYYALGDYDLAVTWLTRAIELEPENLNWYAQRALVYLASGNLEASVADLDHLLSRQSHSMWGYRAVLQLKLGRTEDYQAEVRKMPWQQGLRSCPTWWFTLAPVDNWNKGMREVLSVARDRVNGAETKWPVSSNGLELRKELGTVLYRLGQFEEARKELLTSLEPVDRRSISDPQRALAACFLAMTEHELGDVKAAESWLDQAQVNLEEIASDKPDPDDLDVLQLEILFQEATAFVTQRGM